MSIHDEHPSSRRVFFDVKEVREMKNPPDSAPIDCCSYMQKEVEKKKKVIFPHVKGK